MVLSFIRHWWLFVLIALSCYLIGSINFAWLISRSMHKDITKMGSGNPGTMNMTREFGWKFGLLTFALDALKGGAPVLVAHLIFKKASFIDTSVAVSDFLRYFCAVFVIIGHIYPASLRHRGGKGIASTLGGYWFALSCENLWWILLGFVIAAFLLSFIAVTEWGSLGSLFGVTGCTIAQAIIFVNRYAGMSFNSHLVWLFSFLLALNVLTWFAHSNNVVRLFAGEEHHTSIKKFFKKKRKH